MGAWWTPDPGQVARVDAVLRRLGARRALEAVHAGVGLRFVPPVNSDLGRWEAFWDGGHVAADTDTDVTRWCAGGWETQDEHRRVVGVPALREWPTRPERGCDGLLSGFLSARCPVPWAAVSGGRVVPSGAAVRAILILVLTLTFGFDLDFDFWF